MSIKLADFLLLFCITKTFSACLESAEVNRIRKLVKIGLLPVTLFVLLRPTKSRATEPNPMQPAVTEVFSIAKKLVCLYELWIVSLLTCPLHIFFLSIPVWTWDYVGESCTIQFAIDHQGEYYVEEIKAKYKALCS